MDLTLYFETKLAHQVLEIIDKNIQEVWSEAQQSGMPDDLGYFDLMEHITGLGFVACQNYISAVSAVTPGGKHTALNSPPNHECGLPYAAIVNCAGNYWKHSSEWTNARADSKRRTTIESTFGELGYAVDSEYPLSGVFAEVSSGEASFGAIMQRLQQWATNLVPTLSGAL